MAKVTDDLLLAGENDAIHEFVKAIQDRFKVWKSIVNDVVTFNGCDVKKVRDGVFQMYMESYMQSIEFVEISNSRRKCGRERGTDQENHAYSSLAGEFTWLGSAVMPQASYFASHMQQHLPRLRVEHLIQAYATLKKLKGMRAVISFRKLGDIGETTVNVVTFSDAAFNVSKNSQYGQTCFITGICFNYGLTHITQ